jgi:hypothetical protein
LKIVKMSMVIQVVQNQSEIESVIARAEDVLQAAYAGLDIDLPPEAPSFITRVCGFEFHILGRHVGQARRARSLQVSQALDAPLRVFGFPAMSAV